MATSKKFRCCNCGIQFAIELAKPLNKKKYCEKCFNQIKTEQDELELRHAKQYRKLTDYIKEIAEEKIEDIEEYEENKEFFWKMVTAQIKAYTDEKKDYKYTLGGIYQTLRYIYELEENPPPFDLTSGLSIVPFYYLKASIFWNKQKKIKEANKKENVESEPDIIIIKRSDIIAQEERRKKYQAWQENEEKIESPDIASITSDMFDFSEMDIKHQKISQNVPHIKKES